MDGACSSVAGRLTRARNPGRNLIHRLLLSLIYSSLLASPFLSLAPSLHPCHCSVASLTHSKPNPIPPLAAVRLSWADATSEARTVLTCGGSSRTGEHPCCYLIGLRLCCFVIGCRSRCYLVGPRHQICALIGSHNCPGRFRLPPAPPPRV